MNKRERDKQLKAVVKELKTHLKSTDGVPREDAVAYFAPPKETFSRPATKKGNTRKRTVRKTRG